MEPATPTSFIPKRPVTTAPVADSSTKGASIGILSLITVILIIGTVVSYGGVYLYKKQVEQNKAALQKTITQAKDGLGTDFITQMKRLNARIDGVKQLLKQHVVVTPIFKALQETTLRSVQYKDFSYELTTDQTTKSDIVKVKLTGIAKGYATIALQADAFAQSQLIKNPVFSGLSLNEKRNVTFNLTFDVAADNLSYQSFIDSLNKTTKPVEALTTNPNQSNPTPSTVMPSTTMPAPTTPTDPASTTQSSATVQPTTVTQLNQTIPLSSIDPSVHPMTPSKTKPVNNMP